MTQDRKERKKLTITSKGQEKDYNNNWVLSFAAKDENDVSAGYEVWGRELVDLVVVDAVLDCEITYKPKGEEIINRVTQMFDASGKPIRQRSAGTGRGGYQQARSPQEAAMDRRSAEAQTALEFIGQVATGISAGIGADFANVKEALDKAIKWANSRLDDTMKPWVTPAAFTQPAEPKAAKPETKAAKPEPQQETKKKAPGVTKGQVEYLTKLAEEKKYKKEQVTALINEKFNKPNVGELTNKEAEELRDAMQKGEGLPDIPF